MKKLALAASFLLLILSANPIAEAQAPAITTTLVAAPFTTGAGFCATTGGYGGRWYCLSIPVYDQNLVQTDTLSFQIVQNADGSFANGQIIANDVTGAPDFVSTNWTGANFAGDFSGIEVDGEPFTGHLALSIKPITYKAGGGGGRGNGYPRIITTFHVDSGTGTLVEPD